MHPMLVAPLAAVALALAIALPAAAQSAPPKAPASRPAAAMPAPTADATAVKKLVEERFRLHALFGRDVGVVRPDHYFRVRPFAIEDPADVLGHRPVANDGTCAE